ncbi:MAG TPA: ABC transporter ATP-binding protein, partial [Longimicrobium sp.]|nr:ABC transporter ATP-binding protein [Longimicrobium sp.]
MTDDAVRTAGLVKRHGWLPGARSHRVAVAGLDLHVPVGGITGLLGPNGAGKSTAVKLLLGLARPTAGSATVLGRDAWRDSLDVRREVAFVPEERSVFGWMRTADFIDRVARLSPRWDATVASRLARRWEIDGSGRLRTLSQGTRSRVLLLVALARRASLLLLDEPTTGLDPAAVDDALQELVQAAADGATVLLVTHRLDEVERICDRVAVMSDGRAVLQGDLDDLRATWR